MPLRLVAGLPDNDGTEGFSDQPALEADHRIANNLAVISGLIRAQAASIPNRPTLPASEVRGWLYDMAVRIEAVARLHRLLTSEHSRERVDLAAYLREVADTAMCSLTSSDTILLSMNLAAGTEVSPKQAATIGLMVAEAMTNALKYSHPTGVQGKLHVASRGSSESGLVIEVRDDGVGLPEGFDPYGTDRTGFRIMRTAAKQLGGRLVFEQTLIGLCVRLEINPAVKDASQCSGMGPV
jgi:two-component sensor histidine kinase